MICFLAVFSLMRGKPSLVKLSASTENKQPPLIVSFLHTI